MIRRIKLKNYKQFTGYSISCKPNNIFVGPNNSGKSSILDALRVCSDVLRFAARRRPELASQEGEGVFATFSMDRNSISIPIENVCRNYADEDAEIEITHENGSKLRILLHHDRPLRASLLTTQRPPRTIRQFQTCFPLDIIVVPTLGPLDENELYVQDETVQRNQHTRLARRNFRNIWLRRSQEEFRQFTNLIAESWPGLDVQKPTHIGGMSNLLEMKYKEHRIPREVYWAGFGFQVWMQMITQLMRGGENSILVLDEPDVYLHADLQHKLLDYVNERFSQTFLATHSTELINEASPGDILSVESNKPSAKRISTETDFRHIYSYLGSSDNAEFARMARAKRVVFFEGKDRRLFKKLAKKASFDNLLSDPDTVYLQSGGFEQWRRVKDLNWTLESMFNMTVKIAAIFDRDYRSDEQIEEFLSTMNSETLRTKVLSRKEIENYGLERATLFRLISKRAHEREVSLTESDINEIINPIFESMKPHVSSQLAAKKLVYAKSSSPHLDESTILSGAFADFESAWTDESERLKIIPGKDFISALSSALQSACGISISPTQLINEMRLSEMAPDLTEMISDIDTFLTD